MPFPKYPEIVLLKKRPELFAVKECVATEKLHGSCFRIHFPLGMTELAEVKFGSHETESTDVAFPLGRAVEFFTSRPGLLKGMWEVIKSYGFSEVTVFGEAYGPGIKAKGVKYSNGKDTLFRAFDMMVAENFVTYDLFCEIMDKMMLPRVHEVWRGNPTQEAFDALLEKPSVEGRFNGIKDEGNIAEGVVIRTNPLFRDVFGEWLIAKHKAKKFAEVAFAPAETKVKGESPADAFAQTYVTEGRVRNAIGRLHDRGVALKNDMTDMPTMLTEIIADLHKECEPEWQALGLPDGQLKGSMSRVLGPLYRQLLAEESKGA